MEGPGAHRDRACPSFVRRSPRKVAKRRKMSASDESCETLVLQEILSDCVGAQRLAEWGRSSFATKGPRVQIPSPPPAGNLCASRVSGASCAFLDCVLVETVRQVPVAVRRRADRGTSKRRPDQLRMLPLADEHRTRVCWRSWKRTPGITPRRSPAATSPFGCVELTARQVEWPVAASVTPGTRARAPSSGMGLRVGGGRGGGG